MNAEWTHRDWVSWYRTEYAQLDDATLGECLAAAKRLVDIQQALANDRLNLLTELFRDQPDFQRWVHYPADDAKDPVSGALYYYHAHDEQERDPDEHGHFHTFIRDEEGEGFNHVVAVSMNARGLIRSLFTTNRWVTDELIRPASSMWPRLDDFVIDLARPSWLVSQWLQAVISLFRVQIRGVDDRA